MKRKIAVRCCLFASLVAAAVGAASFGRTLAWGGSSDDRNWFQVWVRDGYLRVEHTRSYNPLAIEHVRRAFPAYLDSPRFREPLVATGAGSAVLNCVFACRTHHGLSNLRILEGPIPVHDTYVRFPLWAVATLLAAYPLFVLIVSSARRRRRPVLNCCTRCGYPFTRPATVRCPACGYHLIAAGI